VRLQVAAFNVRTNLSYLVHEGLSADILYQKIGLSREQLDEPGLMVDVSLSETLLEYGAEQLNAPDLGFRIGKWGDSGRWGVLGHIVDCAQSIEQALVLQKRYQCLVGNGSKSEFSIENKRAYLKWVPHHLCSVYLQEEVVTSWVAFAKKAIGLKLKPLAIHFSHSLPEATSDLSDVDIKNYETFFECPVYFDSDFNGIVFPADILSLPLVGYNPDLLNVLMSYADIIVRKKQKSAANEIITQYIMNTLDEKVPTLNDAADFLGVSTRSLQRKFKEQGTNFKTIVDDVRKDYAYSYLLQTNYKMSYIAQVLGFSEQSVFQRAFKRWTGVTPGEYRESNGKSND
jgi:AraC-like DNA-binding protein